MVNAGMSKCPVCGREWLVTPLDDCMLPACGCFGQDVSENNPSRICESCGMTHAFTCAKMGAEAAFKDVASKVWMDGYDLD